jgi:hypothetical protein
VGKKVFHFAFWNFPIHHENVLAVPCKEKNNKQLLLFVVVDTRREKNVRYVEYSGNS